MADASIHTADDEREPVIVLDGLLVEEAAPVARFSFRGDAIAADTAGKAFGVALPKVPLTSNANDSAAALWLGPDEWLLIGGGEAATMFGLMNGKEGYVPHALVDVSERNVALIVSGPKAARLINSQLFLDLDETVFPVGMATRTVFAKAEIVLWRTAPERFVIECWRSFLPYVAGLLVEAARELEAA